MNYYQAIILGIVEGITEFLPVSSTFHLLHTARFLGLEQTEFTKLFEVFIQCGAVFSLVFLFQKEIWMTKKLYLKLLISTIPVLGFGFLLHSVIKDYFFENAPMLTYVFMGVGVIFIIVEMFASRHAYRLQKGLLDVTYFQALLIGMAQAFALVPGVSRSGSVILAMIFLNYKREDAASYSIALSLPTIIAATVYDLYKSRELLISSNVTSQIDVLIVGFVVSFIVAYFFAKWLVAFLQKHTLLTFGVYRIVAGIILLVTLSFQVVR